jgi:hypothetical protein
MSDDVELLRRVYEFFNRREIERILAAMHPDVVSNPIPLVPPVTSPIFPSSLPIIYVSPCKPASLGTMLSMF